MTAQIPVRNSVTRWRALVLAALFLAVTTTVIALGAPIKSSPGLGPVPRAPPAPVRSPARWATVPTPAAGTRIVRGSITELDGARDHGIRTP